jgi:hypothetical protein
MKPAYILLLASLMASGPAVAAEATGQPPLVVELFTSQGCSSCPPADKYLEELAARDDVLALAWHVDYWDNLGWKDTFSDAAFTRRQYGYAKAMGKSGVYTPQIVINGESEGIGSHRHDIEPKLDEAKAKAHPIALHQQHSAAGKSIEIDAAIDRTASSTLWLVRYLKTEKVKIGRGENSGREILYRNIVREITPLGKWNGKKETIILPPLSTDAYAVILQMDGQRAILAALKIASASQ